MTTTSEIAARGITVPGTNQTSFAPNIPSHPDIADFEAHGSKLSALLADTTATAEQRTALLAAVGLINSRYPDDEDSQGEAFSTAAQIILQDATLTDIGADWATARTAERKAMQRLTGAIIASSATTAETHIAAIAGTDRMTVRKALGKR
jgi:hypothetical protein